MKFEGLAIPKISAPAALSTPITAASVSSNDAALCIGELYRVGMPSCRQSPCANKWGEGFSHVWAWD
jgi:hypothetical protein